MSTGVYNSTVETYPNPMIDPKKKGYDWIMAYCKAAYRDSRGFLPFRSVNTPGTLKMAEIRMYGMAKQPIDKYKKMFQPGNPTDESWRAIDWTVPAFMSKYREISISKMIQQKYDIIASAVDPLAKSEEDEYFNQLKVKALMREAAEKAGYDISQNPELMPQPGEPVTAEEIDMYREYSFKHIMAMQAEKVVALINQQTNDDEIRKQIITHLYDFGVGAKTQWIDENGMVKQKAVDPEYLGISYCEKPDFSDMMHWFEVVPTWVGDLAPYYTKDQLDDICKKSLNKNGNPNAYVPFAGLFNPSWNRFKVYVIKIKFLSWNETVYKEELDNADNMRFRKTDYADKRFMSVSSEGQLVDETPSEYHLSLDQTGEQGQSYPKYMSDVKKVVYKASWVLDTDYMHDWGLQENQNRKLSSWWDTDLDIQIYAPYFYKMQFTGITERLIPFEDRACMLWYNLQNLSNKLIPYLINIDFNAVESVNFGKGGKKQSPSEIIDFIFSNYIVPFRSTDLLSRNPNYKPVSIEATGQLVAFGALYDQLEATKMQMKEVAGLNDVTDASTINAKNLNSTNAAMMESTNNALYLMMDADKYIIQKSAEAIVQKVQIAVKLGKVEGYIKALGSGTMEFFRVSEDISLHEFGISLEPRATDLQRQELWQTVNTKEAQGLVTLDDKIYIMNCPNLKEAEIVLAYKIRKRKEEAHAQQLELLQQQSQGNVETTQAASAAKQEEMMLQAELDIQKIIVEKEYDMRIESMKKNTDLQGEIYQTEGRNIGHAIQAEAKVVAAEIVAEAAKAKAKAAKKTAKK